MLIQSDKNLLCPQKKEKKHDAAMLAESHLYDSLERNAFSTTGEAMCIYGDPAYPLRIHLQAPFRNRVLTPQILAYNSSMSAVFNSSKGWSPSCAVIGGF